MALSYTNRLGVVYHLLEKTSPSGRVTRFFARDPQKGSPVAKMPDGYAVEEKFAGQVYLVKARPPAILPEELETIRHILAAHGKKRHKPCIEKEAIVLYAMPQSTDRHPVWGDFSRWERIISETSGTAVMRFVVMDREKGTFLPQRFCFRGSVEDWIKIGAPGKLKTLAKKFIPYLGTEEIYELY